MKIYPFDCLPPQPQPHNKTNIHLLISIHFVIVAMEKIYKSYTNKQFNYVCKTNKLRDVNNKILRVQHLQVPMIGGKSLKRNSKFIERNTSMCCCASVYSLNQFSSVSLSHSPLSPAIFGVMFCLARNNLNNTFYCKNSIV